MAIDPATLPIDDAIAFRESECKALDNARLVAGIAGGPLKRQALKAITLHHANIMALCARIDGPMPEISNADLLAALLD